MLITCMILALLTTVSAAFRRVNIPHRRLLCLSDKFGSMEDPKSASALKKAAKKTEKEAAKAAKAAARAEESAVANSVLQKTVMDWQADNYGFYKPETWSSCYSGASKRRVWAETKNLDGKKEGEFVWVRGYLHESRGKGNLCFMVLREQISTVQVVLDAKEFVSSDDPSPRKDTLKFSSALPIESVVEIYGKVVCPEVEITSTTQKVELHALKVFCVSKAANELPFQLKDASIPDNAEGENVIRVLQDRRLDHRVLDLRTLANNAIFKISSKVCHLFREYLLNNEFVEIHTPKLIGGSTEGGANVFTLEYFGEAATLAQSPQLYKQMAVAGGLDRVFEVAPVFRAENSNTYRHLCEFTGLDLEMVFRDDFMEVVEFIDSLFQYIFKGLNENSCKNEIESVLLQHPQTPFTYLPGKTPILKFEEGVQMLREVVDDIPDDLNDYDLSTTHEKILGDLMKKKYNTDYYILTHFPLNARAFYSMPTNKKDCPSPFDLCNSYDFFMRGEEILSGAHRITDPEMLTTRAIQKGMDPETIKFYIDAFRLGSSPTAGAGIGLERVVMLYLGLPNVRKTSMFPRDPKRLQP